MKSLRKCGVYNITHQKQEKKSNIMFTKITISQLQSCTVPSNITSYLAFTPQYDGLNHTFFDNHNHKLESKNNENHDWRAPFDTYLPTICFILQQQNCTVKEAIWGLNYVQQLGSIFSGSPALSNSSKCLSNLTFLGPEFPYVLC